MPELPEVLHFKHYIESTSLNQTIAETEILNSQVIPNTSSGDFKKYLEGQKFLSVTNHGKYLFLHSSGDRDLVMHFGMTGHPVYYKDKDKKPDYPRAIFHFKNGYNLVFNCARMLGELELIEEKEGFIQKKELGPDVYPDDFDYDSFSGLMENRRGMIKSSLMDQKLMAGIGNECSDEILFQARIHPKTEVKDLSESELKSIYEKMEMVVKTKLDCMDHDRELPDSFILKNRDEGADCPNCDGTIEKITVGGRSGYYCPQCQKK